MTAIAHDQCSLCLMGTIPSRDLDTARRIELAKHLLSYRFTVARPIGPIVSNHSNLGYGESKGIGR
jgi:hypothetical protein